MDDLRWDDLRAFIAVSRAGTLTAAADALDLNPSTVHRRIVALEELLGGPLFERSPRGYAITSLGEALLPTAQEMEEATLALIRKARGHDHAARGPVALTLPESLLGLLAPSLARLSAACPELDLQVRAEHTVLRLGQGADLALRPSTHPPEDTVGRKVGAIAWAVYGPAIDPGDVPWVVYLDGHGPRRAAEWRQTHHPRPTTLAQVTTVGAMARLLTATAAQGLLPCFVGDTDNRLRRRSPVIDEATTDLWLLLHTDLRRSARVRAVVDALVPALEALAPLLRGEPGCAPA